MLAPIFDSHSRYDAWSGNGSGVWFVLWLVANPCRGLLLPAKLDANPMLDMGVEP